MVEPSTPGKGDELPIQELEPRRDAAEADATGVMPDEGTAALSEPPPLDAKLRARLAVYLIEREAIEFRRSRWNHPTQPPQQLLDTDRLRLAKYDRPEQTPDTGEPAPSRMHRAGTWIKSLFSRESKDRAVLEYLEHDSKCPTPPRRMPAVGNLVGLALSGGGIRSASFNLGVLQGIAKSDMLWIFDYLSTVSGGGFVGAWWSAWLSRAKRRPGTLFPEAEELEPQRRQATAVLLEGWEGRNVSSAADTARHEAGRPEASLAAERDDPIHFLRIFSNYLTPRTGAASPDTWRLIVWYTRSLIFTWAALLPLFCAAVLLAQAFYLTNATVARAFLCPISPAAIIAASKPGSSPAAAVDSINRGSLCTEKDKLDVDSISRSIRLEHLAKLFALFVAAFLTLALLWLSHSSARTTLAALAIAVILVTGRLVLPIFRPTSSKGISWGIPLVAAGIVAVHLYQVWKANRQADKAGGPETKVSVTAADHRSWLTKQQARLLKVGTAVFLLLLIGGFAHDISWFFFSGPQSLLMAAVKRAAGWGGLLLTIGSAAYTAFKAAPSTIPGSKEPPGRIGSLVISIAPTLVVLALAFGLAVISREMIVKAMYLPPNVLVLASVVVWLAVLEIFFAIFETLHDTDVGAREGAFSLARFVPEYILRAFGEKRAKYSGEKRPWYFMFSPRGWARASAAVGFATVLALSTNLSWRGVWGAISTGAGTAVAVLILALVAAISWMPRRWRIALQSARPAVLLGIASASAALSLLSNEGIASRAQGNPILAAFLWIAVLIGAVIGLGWLADPNLLSMHGFYKGRLTRAYLGASNTARDNEEITDAAPGDDVKLTDLWNHALGGPYHLVNTTLSLVGGSDLATSQRSAENFIMSKYHCGSARAGYRCTQEYMAGDLTLATAAAVSGAAVSPTMGSKTPSAALSLLLSLMSVRLGYWAPTPSGRRWNEPHGRLWPFYLLRETLANTGKIGTYCYLTDGGHFDNTGIYALIERGCRYIVCCDCGADPKLGFDDIGNAIRRCRIDFGTEIKLDLSEHAYRGKRSHLLEASHVVRGTIVFQDAHLRMLGIDPTWEATHGVILWIKPVVRRQDSADVRQYKIACPDFPQQSTADQWYDETQFESYRRLGYDSARDAFRSPLSAGVVTRGFASIRQTFEGSRPLTSASAQPSPPPDGLNS